MGWIITIERTPRPVRGQPRHAGDRASEPRHSISATAGKVLLGVVTIAATLSVTYGIATGDHSLTRDVVMKLLAWL